MSYSRSSNTNPAHSSVQSIVPVESLLSAAMTFTSIAPKISVVIPLYNKAEHIVATIESVLAQSVQALEILVIDDGSTDNSVEQVEKHFACTLQGPLKLIQQDNAGVSAARNRGIEEASGDYIALLDADDFWAAHYLEEIVGLIQSFPESGMLATAYQYCDGEQQFVNPKIRFSQSFFKPGLMTSYFDVAAKGDLPFNASSVVIKKELLEGLHGFPLNEPMGEDQDVWSRAALRTDIAYSPKVLSFYNRGAGNRACISQPPSVECPFSRRLYTYAINANIDAATRNGIIDYTVTHLIQLAERNIEFGDIAAANALLGDSRCRRKPLKLMRAKVRALIASAGKLFNESMTSSRASTVPMERV